MKEKNKGINIWLVLLIIVIIIIALTLIIKLAHKEDNNTRTNNTIHEEEITTTEEFGEAQFKVENVSTEKGQEFEIEIDLSNTQDFVAANFEYDYDASKLEYIGYEVGDSLKNGAMTMVNNDKESSKVLIGYVSNPEETDKTIKAGKLVTLKFKSIDNSKNQKIENTFDCTTLKKEDGTDIDFKIEQGIIDIK